MSSKLKQIKFCALDLQGVSRQLFTVKWHKGSFYYIDPFSLRGDEFKLSYHVPFEGKVTARTHIKIQGSEVPGTRTQSIPMEQICGLEPLCGGSCRILELHTYPKPKKEKLTVFNPLPISTTSCYRHYLSTIDWHLYFLENKTAWLDHPMPKMAANSIYSELLGFFIYKEQNPWLIVEFSRLKVEDPLWLQGLDQEARNATVQGIISSLFRN